MSTTSRTQETGSQQQTTAAAIRQRIARRGDSLWRPADFADLPPAATAQTLSRLAREGFLERVAKGVYYRPGKSVFGKTRPNPMALRALVTESHKLFPAGLSAANFLGFSTQAPGRIELATTARSVPKRLLTPGTVVHTRRPAEWNQLSDEEAALLDLMRTGAASSELNEEETSQRLLELLSKPRRFEKLAAVVAVEPPRVAAVLGAAGQELGKRPAQLRKLRELLNPLSRFDFGKFGKLRYAADWQAKD